MQPERAVRPTRARVLVALARVRRFTVRDVAAEAGVSWTVTWRALGELERQGFVTWPDHAPGALRPSFGVGVPR